MALWILAEKRAVLSSYRVNEGEGMKNAYIGKTPKKRKCWRPKSKPEKKEFGK